MKFTRLGRAGFLLCGGCAVVLLLRIAVTGDMAIGAAAEPQESAAKTGATHSEEAPRPESDDQLPPNAACYVCHMLFVGEQISRLHAAADVPCIRCHGLSAAHANDENIGATPPDHTYKRHQVDAQCSQCHKRHNASARAVVARWLERKLDPNKPPVCTDCHGHHRITAAQDGAAGLFGPAPPADDPQ